MEYHASSHGIIKALKGPHDPPVAGGPSKIEIARRAWDAQNIHFPNKNEVLAEWILNGFVKYNKEAHGASLVLSAPYWSLLNSIVSVSSQRTQTNKAWLSNLLMHVSILNILSTFFKSASYARLDSKDGLLEPFIHCIHVFWPVAAPRMNLDALTECLGSILEYLDHDATHLNDLASLCLLVTRAFKQGVGNSSGKKKAFSWFIEQRFIHWVHLICLEASNTFPLNREAKTFISETYQAGVDVFFSVDALKSPSDPLEAILTDSRYSLSNLESSQYQIVPRLYRSYVDTLRRNRSAVFGTSQNQEQATLTRLRDSGMRAFRFCYSALRECGDVLEVWKSIHALLDVLEEENLVGFGITESLDILTHIAASTITILSQRQDDQVERSETALQILCALSCIDFDLLSPLLPDIFAEIVSMNPVTYPSTQSLIRAVLDFHAKTRTMPTYLTLLLRTLSDVRTTMNTIDVSHYHRSCASGAILSLTHLEELSRSIKGFVTPGQMQEVVDSSLATLQTIWVDVLRNGVGEFPNGPESMDIDATNDRRKSRHGKSGPIGPTVQPKGDYAALRYSLVARAVAIILPSLPFASLSGPASESIQKSILDVWTGTLVKAAQYAFTVRRPLDACWFVQSVSTATLRIRHAFLSCSSLHHLCLSDPPLATKKNVDAFALSRETIPEFVIELFRAFFEMDFRYASPTERDSIINTFISYIKSNLIGRNESTERGLSSDVFWDGTSNLLGPDGHVGGALILWHLLLDRWLPIFDEIASQDSLNAVSDIFLQIMARGKTTNTRAGQISIQWAMRRTLHSASFWELANLRDAIVSKMDASTQHADRGISPDLLGQMQDSGTMAGSSSSTSFTWTLEQIQLVLAAFTILLQAPREYLPRNSRPIFIRRAIVTDLATHHFRKGVVEGVEGVALELRGVIRAWLISMCDSFDIADIISDKFCEYTRHLISSTTEEDENDDVDTVTLELFASIFRQAIRSAIRREHNQLTYLCDLLREGTSSLAHRCRLTSIEILVAECTSTDKFPEACLESISQLHSVMRAKYSDALSSALNSTAQTSREQAFAIHSWRKCLVLRKWLNVPGDTSTFSGRLLQRITADKHEASTGDAKEYSTEVFLLLLEELDHAPSDRRRQHIEVTVSAYILLNGRLQLVDQTACDRALARTVRSLPTDEFTHVLSLLLEALNKGLKTSNETQAAVHLSALFLDAAPEGTMKVAQEHFEECLHVFIDEPVFETDNAALILEVLNLIAQTCSDKPAFLRHLALGPIWLLLAKLLTGSETHTNESHPDILHSITSIAGSLIRLRRDLVTSTLPHLGMVLSSLLRALRSPRAQLGARQRSQVSDTLPWWVSPSAPLGVPEAKAVARLLTTLQAKTVPRTFSKDKHKEKTKTAESLLSAFSKHAGPVLSAYINALVDPLVVIDISIREALAPGLYALCEAMGEHGRDALLASGCDDTGRIVLKALWKDYDKQRYVGKG